MKPTTRARKAPLVERLLLPCAELAIMTGTRVAVTHLKGVTVSLWWEVQPVKRALLMLKTERERIQKRRDNTENRPLVA